MAIELKTKPALLAEMRGGLLTNFSGDETVCVGRDFFLKLLDDAAAAHELHASINNPHTDEFLQATRLEAAHQRDRFGAAHDRNKSAEQWFWLVGYLAGKCLRAVVTGDKRKALHHTISSAAALANWYEAIQRDTSGSGAGADADIRPAEATVPA